MPGDDVRGAGCGSNVDPIAPPLFGSDEQYRRRLRGVLESSQADVVVTSSPFVDTVVRASAEMSHAPTALVLDEVRQHRH